MSRHLLAAFVALICQLAVAGEQTMGPIRPFGPETFKQIAANERGKPFVVLIWSLDCSYCEPSFQALAEAKKNHGLKVITLATDPAGDETTSKLMAKKLAPYGFTANAWAFGSWPEERLRYSIDPKWRGELPRSYWFSSDGKVVAHSGVVSSATVMKYMPK